MHPSIALMLRNPRTRIAIEHALASRGQRGDTMLAHINPAEAAALQAMGGAGTRNPRTGLPQFYGSDVGGPGTSDVGGPGNIGGGAGARADAAARGGNGIGGGGIGGNGIGDSGRSGQGNYRQDVNSGVTPPPAATPVAGPPSAPNGGNNMPSAAPPVSLMPFMSKQASTDLTGGAYGALPAWATAAYQVGQVPTSDPTPGVNTGIGWSSGSTSLPGGTGGLGGLGGSGGLGGLGGGVPGGGVPGGSGAGNSGSQAPGLAIGNGLPAISPVIQGVANMTGETPAQVIARWQSPVFAAMAQRQGIPTAAAQQAGAPAPVPAARTQAQSQPNAAPLAPAAPRQSNNPYTPGTAAWLQWQRLNGQASAAEGASTPVFGGPGGLGGTRIASGAPRKS